MREKIILKPGQDLILRYLKIALYSILLNMMEVSLLKKMSKNMAMAGIAEKIMKKQKKEI